MQLLQLKGARRPCAFTDLPVSRRTLPVTSWPAALSLVCGNPMTSDQPRHGELKGITQEIWARTLARIPTTIGRLVYLASLRDDATDIYRDSGLDGHCSQAEADLLLRALHDEAFQTWLSFSLQDQKEDLEQYLQSLAGQTGPDLETWLALPRYMTLIPASAEISERELYELDLKIFLQLRKNRFTES